jgi:hypothetical protein
MSALDEEQGALALADPARPEEQGADAVDLHHDPVQLLRRGEEAVEAFMERGDGGARPHLGDAKRGPRLRGGPGEAGRDLHPPRHHEQAWRGGAEGRQPFPSDVFGQPAKKGQLGLAEDLDPRGHEAAEVTGEDEPVLLDPRVGNPAVEGLGVKGGAEDGGDAGLREERADGGREAGRQQGGHGP